MNRRIDPLSPEERDLAGRLARLGGPREPAPALDAAILAAARAAVTEAAIAPTAEAAPGPAAPPATPAGAGATTIRPRRTVPRWPWGMGLAASVVLAAGIGWKLQGDGEGSSAESAAAPTTATMADEAMEAVMIDPPAAPPPPPPLEADAAGAPQRRDAEALARTAAKAGPGFVADAPATADAIAEAVSAAPPAPVAAAPAVEPEPPLDIRREEKAVFDLSGTQVPRSEIPSDRAAGAAEYTRTPLNQRREQQTRASRAAQAEAPPAPPPPAPALESPRDRARRALGETRGDTMDSDKRSGNAATSGGYDERPPVSADSPEFRQAWLQRIRALLAAGDTAAAGQSLQEFRRRYPDVELPDDLRKLAATLPPPAP